MNRSELKKKLDAAQVPEWEYSFTENGPLDDRYIMINKGGKWRVYYYERGQETQEGFFETESEACEYLEKKLLPRSFLKPFPLGSVVRLHGGTLKLMIVARALRVPGKNGKQYYFDYGAVAYPNGFVTLDMAYFQQDAVEEIFHWGYTDEEDDLVLQSIHQYLEMNPNIERGSAEKINQ